jgi:hypothetical protein
VFCEIEFSLPKNLQTKQNKYDVNLLFLEIVKTFGSTAINQFYRVLVITGQDALAELLTESKNVTSITEIEKGELVAKFSRFATKNRKFVNLCSNMIECTRRYTLCLCDELHKTRNNVFNACGRGDFESEYCTPDLVHLQYNNRTFAGPDGHWNKVGEMFGHKELIDEITTNNYKGRNILLEVCSQRICFTSLPARRQTQEVVKHNYSTTLRGYGQHNKKIRH